MTTITVEMLIPKPCAHVARPDGIACDRCGRCGNWPRADESLGDWYLRRRQEVIEDLNREFDELEAEYAKEKK